MLLVSGEGLLDACISSKILLNLRCTDSVAASLTMSNRLLFKNAHSLSLLLKSLLESSRREVILHNVQRSIALLKRQTHTVLPKNSREEMAKHRSEDCGHTKMHFFHV